MQLIWVISSLAFLLFGISLYQQWEKAKRIKIWLKENYGKKPKNDFDYDFKKIEIYWKENEHLISDEEKIDDITWNDLDFLSVFKRINVCCSFVGEQVLYAIIHYLPKKKDYGEILEKKIIHFASKKEEREAIQYLLYKLGKQEVSYNIPFIINNLEAFEIERIWLYKLMQILLFIPLLPAIIFLDTRYLMFSLFIFGINILLYAHKKIQCEIHLTSLNSIVHLVNVGNQIAKSKQFSYEEQFHDLGSIVNSFQKLLNMVVKLQYKKDVSTSGDIFGIIYDYIIGATLWDITTYDKAIHCLKGKQYDYMKLYKKIGEIDMEIAIASFRESLPAFCNPIFCDEHIIKMKEVYHPLIDEPICNSVILNRNCIITGSNASGKSTYIKAVAVNIILAQSINTCMAERMELPYTRIITSMAVRDDLMAGESYYIKEIKYIKRIIQSLSNDRFVVCIVDEILRGTNTEERIAASASILNFLCDKNCLVIVASHDKELTEILKSQYDNYHFEEKILGNDIIFDYKIHDGASQTKNAIKLLEFVGFPNEIIINAQKGYLQKS